MATKIPLRTVEQLAFTEAARRNLTAREFGYLFAQSGLKDRGFDAAHEGLSFDSPKAAGAWLKYVPPVSLSAGVGVASAGIDTRSAADFLWTLAGEADARQMDLRINDYRTRNAWAEDGLGAVIRRSFDPQSDIPSEMRDRIINAWNEVRKQNPSLPPGDSRLNELVAQFGAGNTQEFVKTYLLRNGDPAAVAAAVADLEADRLEVDDTALTEVARQAAEEATGKVVAQVQQLLSDENTVEAQAANIGSQLRFERTVKEFAGGMAIAASLARITGNPELARTIANASDPIVKIAGGIGEFLKNDGLKLAATGNIVGGALALMSLFGGGDPPDPMLSAILENTKIMMKQLNQILDELDGMKTQLRQLTDLAEKIQTRLEEARVEILATIERLRRDVASMQAELREDVRALAVSNYLQDYSAACRLITIPAIATDLERGALNQELLIKLSDALASQESLGTWVAASPPLHDGSTLTVEEVSMLTSDSRWAARIPAVIAWLQHPDTLENASRLFEGSVPEDVVFQDRDVVDRFDPPKLAEYLQPVDPASFAGLVDPDAWYLGIVQYIDLARFIPRQALDAQPGFDTLLQAGLKLTEAVRFLARATPIAYAAWRVAALPLADYLKEQRYRSTVNATDHRFSDVQLASVSPSFGNARFAGLLDVVDGGEIDWGKRLEDKDRQPGADLNQFEIRPMTPEERQQNPQAQTRVFLTRGGAFQYHPVQWTDWGSHVLKDVGRVAELPLPYGKVTFFDGTQMTL